MKDGRLTERFPERTDRHASRGSPRIAGIGPCPSRSVSRRHSADQAWLNALETSLAVMSTIGMTRSYAMRVGPITPSVPTTRPSLT